MSTTKTKLLYLFTTIAFILACVPAIALTPYPTTDPNELSTIIVLTANAASTQTAAAMPTATFTPSVTPTRPTETPSPTETPTVIFILSTPTQIVVPTFTLISSGGGSGSGSGSGGSSGSSSENYACQILSVSPANGTTMNDDTDFDAIWKVKNIGQKTWDQNSVDFVYDSGTDMAKRDGYDLNSNVKSGQEISLGADMVAPTKPGNYTTNWTLRVGNNEFCKMSLTINVK
jgi:Ig-like domain-containing protein